MYASYIVFGSADIKLEEYKVLVSGPDDDEVKEAEKPMTTLLDLWNFGGESLT